MTLLKALPALLLFLVLGAAAGVSQDVAPPAVPPGSQATRFGVRLELPAGSALKQQSRMLAEFSLGGGDCNLRLGRGDPIANPRRLMQSHQRIYLGTALSGVPAGALEQLPREWQAQGALFQPRAQTDKVAALFWTASDEGWFAYLRCGGRQPKDPWLDPALGLVTLLKGLGETKR